MERATRFELATLCLGSRHSTTELRPQILEQKLERAMRIELTWPAWKAGALPLSYARSRLSLWIAEARMSRMHPKEQPQFSFYRFAKTPSRVLSNAAPRKLPTFAKIFPVFPSTKRQKGMPSTAYCPPIVVLQYLPSYI